MATSITYVLFKKNTRKDGSIPVKIRLTHNRKTKYFPTAVFVTKDQLDRKKTKIKDVRITEALDDLVKQYRCALAAIGNAQWIDADELAAAINASMKRENGFRLDFFEYAEGKIAGMKPKTAETYRTAMNALKRFVGGDRLDISRINLAFITGFKTFLETEPPVPMEVANPGKKKHKDTHYKAKSVGCRAVSLYLSNVRAIYNKAIDEFNDDYYTPIRNLPFKRSTIPPQPQTDHRALTKEQMRDVIRWEPKNGLQRQAKDVFLLSFYLVGMNTIDIYKLTKTDMKDGVITYNRSKTKDRRRDKALMRIRVEPEAMEIIERYRSEHGDSLLVFSERYATPHGFNGAVNKHLKCITMSLTTYYPRHTWATLALNECGVDFDTVDFSLNHAKTGNDKVTEIYIKRDFSKIWDANRKVLDLVFGKKI